MDCGWVDGQRGAGGQVMMGPSGDGIKGKPSPCWLPPPCVPAPCFHTALFKIFPPEL